MTDDTDRSTTIEYGVGLKVTPEFGSHRGNGYHYVTYWTSEPDSEAEAKELLRGEKGVVEVFDDVQSRGAPAPEKWSADTGTAQSEEADRDV